MVWFAHEKLAWEMARDLSVRCPLNPQVKTTKTARAHRLVLSVFVLAVSQVLRYLVNRRLACKFIRPAILHIVDIQSSSRSAASMRNDRVASLSARRLICSSRWSRRSSVRSIRLWRISTQEVRRTASSARIVASSGNGYSSKA